jgi:uncharacterized membrane-anchored protein YhcB (DUF1043 family)
MPDLSSREDTDMLFYMLLAFAAGVFVGYKFPRQVEQAMESTKKLANDLKDKVTKKGAPPAA